MHNLNPKFLFVFNLCQITHIASINNLAVDVKCNSANAKTFFLPEAAYKHPHQSVTSAHMLGFSWQYVYP